jgi:uncharacterized protein (DUF2141 family)
MKLRLLGFLPLLLPLPAAAGDLVVIVEGLRNDHGEVRLGLFTKEGWLDEKRTVGHADAKATLPATRLVVHDVAPGIYGIAAFHDENGNGKHDTNFIGLPLEGVGFSRDAPIRLGPPKFEDAEFEVGADGAEVHFKMRYF